MPRTPRLDYPGARQHVMNRGIRQEHVFLDDHDRNVFLDILGRTPARFGVRVHAFAVMGNHYHVLFEVPRGNLSQCMQFVGLTYARYANDRHGWDGPLWRGRFRNRLVEDDAYWRHLFAYVHLNPVEAGVVDHPDHARWTSHRAHIGLERRPPWLCSDDLIAQFGTIEDYRRYVADVHAGREHGPETFDPEDLWVPPSTDMTPTVREERATLDLLYAIRDIGGREYEDLASPQRGPRHDRDKLLVTWFLYAHKGLTQAAIGQLLGISRSAVSRRLKRFEELLATDAALRALLDALQRESGAA